MLLKKSVCGSFALPIRDSLDAGLRGAESMMGWRKADQTQLFYAFNLDERFPATHLLRRIDVFVAEALTDVHREMACFYSHTGRPSIDPELLIRMLLVGYCCGIRSERRLCEEVSLNLAYRWFCPIDLDDAIPDRSSFSKNRHVDLSVRADFPCSPPAVTSHCEWFPETGIRHGRQRPQAADTG